MDLRKTRLSVSLTLLLLLTAGTAISQADQSSAAQVEALQKQLDSLQAQMAEVQAAIKNLSAESESPTGSTAPAQEAQSPSGKETVTVELNKQAKHQVGRTTTTYETYSEDPEAAPRVDNAPLDPRYPGYFRLPGTQTLLKIGGYFKTDFIRDIRPAGDTERFIPSSIPVPASGGGTNTTVSVRPTRLSLDFLIPTERAGSVRFYLEGDLFGSSATTPRMRHAYAQVANFLIGQTFSNFQNPDAGPDQLDFQGPNAQVSIRNPQFRYSIPLSKKTSLRFGIEKASSDIAFKTPEFSAQPSNQMPDGTVTLRHELEKGNIQLSGLFRSVGAFLPSGADDTVFGWGVHLSGSVGTIGRDTAVYQVAYGHGIERYLNDTSGLGIDATVDSVSNPELEALPVVATYGAYQHFWLERLRSSLIYGFVQVDNTEFQPGSAFHQSNYSAANLIWNPVGSLNVGAEFLYGWVVKKDGSSGNAPRLMLSAKYTFVKMEKAK